MPAPVTICIHPGKDAQGVGQLGTGPERILQFVCELIVANGEEMSRRKNFWVDHIETASPKNVLRVRQGTDYIEIEVKQ